MSQQEIRNILIRENLSKLLRSLTGFDEDDENYVRCQQFALSTLRIHRTISTNSHEIRRKIEAMKEKLQYDNLYEEAEILGVLCEQIINHPLCLGHYELDIHWSLIDLLLSLSFNPTRYLRKLPKHFYQVIETSIDEPPEKPKDDLQSLIELLKEDFIPINYTNQSKDDDELSVWSDQDENGETLILSQSEDDEKDLKNTEDVSKTIVAKQFCDPPSKDICYEVVEYDHSYVEGKFQHQWWKNKSSLESLKVPDKYLVSANFAMFYHEHLKSKYFRLVQPLQISTEYSLLREILWMFHKPLDCKFFHWDNNEFRCRKNVSIASATADSLNDYVEEHFIPYIQMMHKLNEFLALCQGFKPRKLPKTYECYAAALRTLLKPIWEQLLTIENKVMYPSEEFIGTVINLKNRIYPSCKLLESIYRIHERIVLDIKTYPPHILSTFMSVELMHIVNTAAMPAEENLACYIFLTVIRIFCQLLDTWWSKGCIEDPKKEFLARSHKGETNGIVMIRSLLTKIEKDYGQMIKKSSLYHVLMQHCHEAGSLLNMLYKIDRLNNLKKVTGSIIGCFYQTLLDDLQEILSWYIENSKSLLDKSQSIEDEASPEKVSNDFEMKPIMDIEDEYLSLVFMPSARTCNASDNRNAKGKVSSDSIYSILKKSNVFLPLEEIILKIMKKMLKNRIKLADDFVRDLMLKEFALDLHLKNIRSVLLLEASDLMYQFYSDLFKQIESGKSWANAYLLTSNLNDLLCSRFIDMNNLFGLEVNPAMVKQTDKVCQAIDEISIKYNVPKGLSFIITPQAMEDYNKIFQLLLKVKWGLMALENMRFINNSKRCLVFDMNELLMRRLEHLRFWMLHDLQIVHFHLTANVLERMNQQLQDDLGKCGNFKQIVNAHKAYLDTIVLQCCLTPALSGVKLGVEQLINLIFILRLEWKGCLRNMSNNDPMSITLDDSTLENETNYITHNQVDDVEHTFIRCHQYLANHLNKQVYIKQNDFLSGFSCAFNASLPY